MAVSEHYHYNGKTEWAGLMRVLNVQAVESTKLRTTQGAEKPLFAYFVEKLSNTKIASKIWRLILLRALSQTLFAMCAFYGKVFCRFGDHRPNTQFFNKIRHHAAKWKEWALSCLTMLCSKA